MSHEGSYAGAYPGEIVRTAVLCASCQADQHVAANEAMRDTIDRPAAGTSRSAPGDQGCPPGPQGRRLPRPPTRLHGHEQEEFWSDRNHHVRTPTGKSAWYVGELTWVYHQSAPGGESGDWTSPQGTLVFPDGSMRRGAKFEGGAEDNGQGRLKATPGELRQIARNLRSHLA